MDRRGHKRYPADFIAEVTVVDDPGYCSSGEVLDVSESGIGVSLPHQIAAGSAVRLKVNDSMLHGFVVHSTPQNSRFRVGIEVIQVLIGDSELSQLLRATLEDVMPELQGLGPRR